MEKRNTKLRILEEALNLFSVQGYDGVSVKDIAKAVGIKDSSLYKHYNSKQQIFQTLLEDMNRRFDEAVARYQLPQGEVEVVARQYGENDQQWLRTAVDAVFLFFVRDEYAVKFTHLLMIERYKNSDAARMFDEWFIDGALGFQTALFRQMMEEGYFRQGDPRALAVQFHGPIFFLIIMYDSKPEQEAEALELLHKHVDAFIEKYHISYTSRRDHESE